MMLCAVGCGEEQPTVVQTEEPAAAKVKTGDILSEWRKEAARGEGGAFVFTYGEQNFSTEWGYVDFRTFNNKDASRLTLLSNPLKEGQFPVLRIAISSELQAIEEFIGNTVQSERITLKLEKKKKAGIKGTGSVTINAITDGFMEGSFTAELENGQKVEGTFKARLNLPDAE